MGLLDEAIREHLELKRRQGADPGEIARKEREALAPVVPNEPSSWGADPSPHGSDEAHGDHADGKPSTAAEHTANGAHELDLSTVGQETAELDMHAVLYEDSAAAVGPSASAPAGPAGAAPVRASSSRPSQDEDPLDWEMPGGDSGEQRAIEEIPGQERLSFE
jgi:hypothetical protein